MSSKKKKPRKYNGPGGNRKRKYGQRTRTEDGFASLLEQTMWKQTKKLLPKNHKLSYETDKLSYVLEKNYVPDFIITRPDGSKLYIEVKGYFRPSDRTKLLAVKAKDPRLDIRLAFSRDNKLHSKSNTLYSEWCTKHGFKYCIGDIPKEWFEVRNNGKRHLPKRSKIRPVHDRPTNLDLFSSSTSEGSK